MGMVSEHGTPLAQQNINVGRPPSTGTYPQVCILPMVMLQKKMLSVNMNVLLTLAPNRMLAISSIAFITMKWAHWD